MSNDVVILSVINPDIKAKILRSLISEAKGHIFAAYFRKSDGSLREILCRRHVNKGIKGTSKVDVEKVDKEHNQLTVFDMQKNEFRKIRLDTVLELKIDNVWYIVDEYSDRTKTKFELLKMVEHSGVEKNIVINVIIGDTIVI